MTLINREHWKTTKHLTNPKARYYTGHHTTAKQLQQIIENR